MRNHMDSAEYTAAMTRLLALAKTDTGGARRAANLILAWWNADTQGAFDFTDLWGLDSERKADALTIIEYLTYAQEYPIEFRQDIEEIMGRWRSKKAKR